MSDQAPELYAHLERQQRLTEAADQENAELVAWLRARCSLLNAEVRVRDAELAQLRARVAELEAPATAEVVRQASDEPADDPALQD